MSILLFMCKAFHTQKHKLQFTTLQVSTCFVTLLGHCSDEHVGKQDTDFIFLPKIILSGRYVELTCEDI